MDAANHVAGYPPPDPHMNGNIHHGLPMHPHEQPGHPMAPGYGPEYAQSPVATTPHPYGGMPYGLSLGPPCVRPKKGNRATQACDICRTRKAKCDEGRPRCGFCDEQDLPCNYQSVVPAKVDRAHQVILDQLEAQQRDLKSLKQDFVSKMENIERLLSSQQTPAKDAASVPDDRDTKPPTVSPETSDQPAASSQKSETPAALASSGHEDPKMDASPCGSCHTNSTESGCTDLLPSVPKQNAIHTEHNTAAQKLFRWPAIKALLQQCRRLQFTESSENYVFNMELTKGPLHLYGKGQGPDLGDRIRLMGSASPKTSSSRALSDEVSDVASPPSPPANWWGEGFSPFVGESKSESTPGGLNPDNTLKLDAKTVSALYSSYMANIQILHPILDEVVLTRNIETFKRRYGGRHDPASSNAGFAVPAANTTADARRDSSGGFNKPLKRKLSDGQHWTEAGVAQPPRSPRPILERSPTTAVILLVMALGKICECRRPLPGPVASLPKDAANLSAPSYSPPALGTELAPQFSVRHSPSSSAYSNAPSPAGLARQNHASPQSSDAGLAVHMRNLDVIPGLAYYAQATDILGNLTGSHDITYVQCCLLAGLYAGQLANAVESLVWIQSAARGCCILARDDILAEIDFPPSGIRNISGVDYPHGYFPENAQPPQDTPRKSQVMLFYTYQLHLRNLLDATQQDVYPPGKDLTEIAKNKNLRAILTDWLMNWRTNLPEELRWNDGDEPVKGDVNQARLRGKYYGALYIIHRPMLYYALELEAGGHLDNYVGHTPDTALGPMRPPKTRTDPLFDDVVEAARVTIMAAVWSTQAFDGIIESGRLIVTNIFGTAHAQFGNMLVLSAAYKSKYFRTHISPDPRRTMEYLFYRTIRFFETLKDISPTLGHDQFILRCLREVIFEADDESLLALTTAPPCGVWLRRRNPEINIVNRATLHPSRLCTTGMNLNTFPIVLLALSPVTIATIGVPKPAVILQERPLITPSPATAQWDPTKTLQRRGIISDITGDVNSILTGLGSDIPSYVASGVPNFFQDFPTGDKVQSSLGIDDDQVRALPTQVLNIPGYGNWTEQGWNLRFHGNVYKQPSIPQSQLDDLANVFLIDTSVQSLPPPQASQARNLTAEIFVIQQDNRNVTFNIAPAPTAGASGEQGGGGAVTPSGGQQTIEFPDPTTAQGDFDGFVQIDSNGLSAGNSTSNIQRLNVYTQGDINGNATAYLVPESGLTVISDIDDILRVTKIYEPKEGLLNSFAKAFTPWMNMPEIYANWSRSIPNFHFHYLTTTPEQVTRNYMDFIYRTYPGGSFDTRPLNFSDVSATLSIRKFLLEKIFQTYPNRKFVLVADTTNSDVMR
ncbi:MAG: hypothetical protein Q9163_006188, partial [Psora crenata]